MSWLDTSTSYSIFSASVVNFSSGRFRLLLTWVVGRNRLRLLFLHVGFRKESYSTSLTRCHHLSVAPWGFMTQGDRCYFVLLGRPAGTFRISTQLRMFSLHISISKQSRRLTLYSSGVQVHLTSPNSLLNFLPGQSRLPAHNSIASIVVAYNSIELIVRPR